MLSFLWKEKKTPEQNKIYSPVTGNVIPTKEVNDPIFSEDTIGKGVAVIPEKDRVVAPADGTVSMVFRTKHALSMITNQGTEIMIHIGLDTVKLNGQYFTDYVKVGDQVKTGDLLMEIDLKKMQKAGYDLTTIIIICNTDQYPNMICHSGMHVKESELIISLK